jgi:hypothetical protein
MKNVYRSANLREIDRVRMKAQVDLLNRITKGGQVDPELAVAERLRLADRVADKRTQFTKWMKAQGFKAERIKGELARFDNLLAELRRDPSKMVDLSGLRSMLEGA